MKHSKGLANEMSACLTSLIGVCLLCRVRQFCVMSDCFTKYDMNKLNKSKSRGVCRGNET